MAIEENSSLELKIREIFAILLDAAFRSDGSGTEKILREIKEALGPPEKIIDKEESLRGISLSDLPDELLRGLKQGTEEAIRAVVNDCFGELIGAFPFEKRVRLEIQLERAITERLRELSPAI